MKIGIMTFWWSEDNYGQLLQCYALQKYLSNAGHDAFLIRYNFASDYRRGGISYLKAFNPVKVYRFIRAFVLAKKAQADHLEHARYFNEFRSRYIRQSATYYSALEQLRCDPPEADVYITGSDQIWNVTSMPPNAVLAYFLSFGNANTKKIAYAASFGLDVIPQKYQKIVKRELAEFRYVSVRERNAVDICERLGRADVEWVPDPTLLLLSDHYRSISAPVPSDTISEKYCLVYMLNNTCDFSMDNLKKWALDKGVSVKYVTGNSMIDSHEKIYPSILEWLHLVDGAEYVITNSFHCCVFSLLFHKRFSAVPLKGDMYRGMNGRLESLFVQFGVQRFLDPDYSVFEGSIDWDNVESRLSSLRSSVRLLDVILDCTE